MLKILFANFTKEATLMRKSTVVILPPQLVFPALSISPSLSCKFRLPISASLSLLSSHFLTLSPFFNNPKHNHTNFRSPSILSLLPLSVSIPSLSFSLFLFPPSISLFIFLALRPILNHSQTIFIILSISHLHFLSIYLSLFLSFSNILSPFSPSFLHLLPLTFSYSLLSHLTHN
jgi:hypothetical protein